MKIEVLYADRHNFEVSLIKVNNEHFELIVDSTGRYQTTKINDPVRYLADMARFEQFSDCNKLPDSAEKIRFSITNGYIKTAEEDQE
jgi:hypothetical protein